MEFFDRLFRRKNLLAADVIEEVSLRIFANALAGVRVLVQHKVFEELGDDPDQLNPHGWTLLFEHAVLSLFLAERLIFGTLGPEKRSGGVTPERRRRFVSALEQAVLELLAKLGFDDPSPEAQRFTTDFQDLLACRAGTYAGLGAPTSDKEDLAGTLFWEAAKTVTHERFPEADGMAFMDLSLTFALCQAPLRDLSKTLRRVRDL